MAHTITAYRVFIASPGGLAPERQAFRDAIASYNEMDAISRDVMFIPVAWEQTLPGMGRPQSLINEDLKDCDYFVLTLWDRWGSPSGDERYTSATSEEYSIAHQCWKDPSHCLREIAAFFKAVDPKMMNDPGEQLKKVLDFRRSLEETKELLFGTFDDTTLFQRQVHRLLAKWVRDHEQQRKGRTDKTATSSIVLSSPSSSQPLPATVSTTAGLSGLDKTRGVIEEADRLVAMGHLTDAEMLFARALARDNEPGTAIQYARFLRRLGRFSQAQAILEGVLARTAPGEEHWKAGAYNYLGMLHRDLGEFEQAEKKLTLAKGYTDYPGTRETTIAACNNLGQLFRDRGELTQAEEMHKMALGLCRPTGDELGTAAAYGNLAHVYLLRNDLEGAESANRKAIELSEGKHNDEGLAIALKTQGLLHIRRNEVAEAAQALSRSLAIATRIGRLKSMADAYLSLAQLKMAEREYAEAEQMVETSLETNERIGRKKGVARAFQLLGEIRQADGRDVDAEQPLLRAVDLARAIGDRACLARAYTALGRIFSNRGERSAAMLLWREARDVFNASGMSDRAATVAQLLETPSRAATSST